MWKFVVFGIAIGMLSAALSAGLALALGRQNMVKGVTVLGGVLGAMLFIKVVDQHRK